MLRGILSTFLFARFRVSADVILQLSCADPPFPPADKLSLETMAARVGSGRLKCLRWFS